MSEKPAAIATLSAFIWRFSLLNTEGSRRVSIGDTALALRSLDESVLLAASDCVQANNAWQGGNLHPDVLAAVASVKAKLSS